MLNILKDASSRCPQKSRRREVRFALWYASVSKAGDGKSNEVLSELRNFKDRRLSY